LSPVEFVIPKAIVQERLAAAGAAVSLTAGSLTWLATINEVAKLVLTVVGIVAGIASYRYYTSKRNQR